MLNSPTAKFYVSLRIANTVAGAQSAADPSQSMQGVSRAIHQHRPILFIWLGHGRHD
jgi:hypothetical protein